MTKPSSERDKALAPDACDLQVLEAELGVTPIVRESVRGGLSSRGRLWRLKGTQSLLVSRADYLAALAEFCARVPAAGAFLAERRSREKFDLAAQTRRLNDELVRPQLPEMAGERKPR